MSTRCKPEITDIKKILLYNIIHEGYCNFKCDCYVCPISCSKIYAENKKEFKSFTSVNDFKERRKVYYSKVREASIKKYIELYSEEELVEQLVEELL